ncbi:hypothetical protein [Arthrobacter crystallopoietes]|uniref:Uncharacterized protein n=1 Tax=Crystallibacter crystallopoietes TaxID=37928 RepID=A0A1H1CT97_9MICC|nr:hypothetical protein [Arthrobacter crystallopoietes]SDQ67392.1 hypothetical protein SAMN04489742_2076 [Arthrobacter crystallopoietes]
MLAVVVAVADPDRIVATDPAFLITMGEGHVTAATQVTELDSEVFVTIVQPNAFPLYDMTVTDEVDGYPLVLFVVFASNLDTPVTEPVDFQISIVITAVAVTVAMIPIPVPVTMVPVAVPVPVTMVPVAVPVPVTVPMITVAIVPIPVPIPMITVPIASMISVRFIRNGGRSALCAGWCCNSQSREESEQRTCDQSKQAPRN